MEKIKVIQIAHASHSYFANKGDKLKDITLNDWYSKTSKQLRKYYPKIDVECWAPEKEDKGESSFTDSGVLFRFFPVTFSPIYALDFSIPMLKELKKEIQKSKKENYKLIIHLHEYHNLHGLLIATLFKKNKIICQHHGGSPPLRHLSQTKRYRLFFPIFILGQIWENMVLKNIDSFYALSQDEIDYLKKVCPKSNTRFQTMGIDDFYFNSVSKTSARKKLKLPQNKKIILFIGRINEVKGVRYLLDSMKELESVELKIIGFGPEEEKYKNYAKENKLSNVEFLGGVFGDKKLLYLSSADLLVLPSSKEGAPVTVMEAMARNLPCVVSNVGGVSLMIKNKENGIIIQPKSSEDIVLGVKEVLGWKSKNLKKYAEKYRWKKIIEDTVKDYYNN
ncbi:D-inositol-3-phosphate glycosyltransferase [uncultured archaeon]|nr:D-inositol-3-phosphate glycosyltransferase [uncultured archaeon]